MTSRRLVVLRHIGPDCARRPREAAARPALFAIVLLLVTSCSAPSLNREARLSALLRSTLCSTAEQAGSPLVGRHRSVPLGGTPWGLALVGAGHSAIVALSRATQGELAIVRLGERTIRVTRIDRLPSSLSGAKGIALSTDRRLLLVAGEREVGVFSVPRLLRGRPAELGFLRSQSAREILQVAISNDNRYAFATDEALGDLFVFNLHRALTAGFGAPGVLVSRIHLAPYALGIAITPNDAHVFVTTLTAPGDKGQLWTIDARRAEHGATRSAVVGAVRAGCQPVRVIVSPDGQSLWLTNLQSNRVIAFSVPLLLTEPQSAVQAIVTVGSEPGGLTFLGRSSILAVLDSARFEPSQRGQITLLDSSAALAGRDSILGSLRTEYFPRALVFDKLTNALVVSNYVSESLETISVPRRTTS